jgi:hypothetical protein
MRPVFWIYLFLLVCFYLAEIISRLLFLVWLACWLLFRLASNKRYLLFASQTGELEMKQILMIASILLLSASFAQAGTIRGGGSTRSWCDVGGENVSVSPKEPPSAKWKKLCKQAGGKIKRGLVKMTALAIKSKAGGGKAKTLGRLNGQKRRLQAKIRSLSYQLKKAKAAYIKLMRKYGAIKRLR